MFEYEVLFYLYSVNANLFGTTIYTYGKAGSSVQRLTYIDLVLGT